MMKVHLKSNLNKEKNTFASFFSREQREGSFQNQNQEKPFFALSDPSFYAVKDKVATAPHKKAHISIDEAIETFSKKINSDRTTDKKVTAYGQFYWTSTIKGKLYKRLKRVFKPKDALYIEIIEILKDINYPSRMTSVLERIVSIKKKIEKHSNPSIRALKDIFTDSIPNFTALQLWRKLNQKNKVPLNILNRMINIPDLIRIREEEKLACYNVADLMIGRFQRRGGYSTIQKGKRQSSNKFVQTLSTKGMRHYDWEGDKLKGDIVKYKTDPKAATAKMKRALDDGFLIHARVVSGTNFGHGLDKSIAKHRHNAHPPKPREVDGIFEHSLVIIGYDNNKFVFWDPDSSVSVYDGKRGFGLLYFHNNRLSTAKNFQDLIVNKSGNHANRNKRYQVLYLNAY